MINGSVDVFVQCYIANFICLLIQVTVLCARPGLYKMVLCQGLSAGQGQLLAFPAAKPPLLRRSCIRIPAGSPGLKSARLSSKRKKLSVQAVRGNAYNDLIVFFKILLQS